ncbi:MAG: hypothetical protein U0840_16830 [Gemmataceae bacterium]
MRYMLILSGLLLAGWAMAEEEKKGSSIDLDGVESKTPAAWVKEAPANTMRFAQFKLPKVKGDKDDGELVIFKGLGGSAEANIDRWKKQFVAPKGKGIDDISKVTNIEMAGGKGLMVEVSGTYMFNPAPFNPRSKAVPREEYKMVGIHLDGPKDVYHIRMVGPAKTMDHYRKGFEEWVKGYKK